MQAYRQAVADYKHTNSKESKKQLVAFLEEIKQGFRTTLANNDPLRQRMSKLRGTIAAVQDPDLFGAVKVDKAKLASMKKELQKLEAEREQIETNKVYEGAFEWRFEFPEVLDEEGKYVGFDVVLGNPPYIRQEELGDFKLYLKKAFATFAGTADLYVYFVEQGINLLKKGGQFSYIIPNKWMRAGYGQGLRSWLQNYTLEALLDFGDLPVFEEATTYPLIISVAKKAPVNGYTFKTATIITLDFEQGLSHYVQEQGYEVKAQLLPNSGWNLSNSTSQQLLEKLKNAGVTLGEYVEGKIFYGIKTGYNEAFVIDEITKEKLIQDDPRSAEIIKPYLSGKDIKRYSTPEASEYLILLPRGITKENVGNVNEEQGWNWLEENYNSIASFMQPFAEKARNRTDKGDYWWELRACGYYNELEKPKIIWPETSLPNHFIFDLESKYINKTCFMIPSEDIALFAILNSKLSLFYLEEICSKMRGGYLMLSKQHVSQLPIATADEETKASITSLVEQVLAAKQADAAADTSELEAEIDVLVYRLYNLTYDEVLLVEPGFGLSREEYMQAADLAASGGPASV